MLSPPISDPAARVRSILWIATCAAYFLVWSGCAVSSAPFQQRVDREEGFDQSALESGGLAVLPVIADSGASEYRRPMLQAFYREMNRLAPDVVIVPADSMRPQLQTRGRAQAYRDAFDVYRETGILEEDLFLEIADERAAQGQNLRYFLVPYVLHPRVYFNPHRGQHRDLSTRRTVEATGFVWDAETRTVVWDAELGAGSRTNAFEYHGESSREMSQKTGVALARALLGRWTVPPTRSAR